MLKSMTADIAVHTSIYTSVNSIYPTKRNKWLESVCETKIDKDKSIKYKRLTICKKCIFIFVIECLWF